MVGDEFGPYVLRVTHQGRVLGVVEAVVGGKAFRGPDHYMNGCLPNYPGDTTFEVRRSGGFEPMAKPKPSQLDKVTLLGARLPQAA